MEVVLSSEAETQVSVVIASLAGAPFIEEYFLAAHDWLGRASEAHASGTYEAMAGPVLHDRFHRLIGYLTGRPHSGGETAEALVQDSGGAS
jgi:hypothetical protein